MQCHAYIYFTKVSNWFALEILKKKYSQNLHSFLSERNKSQPTLFLKEQSSIYISLAKIVYQMFNSQSTSFFS